MRLEAAVQDANLDADAFNLANCDAHCALITRAIRDLLTNNFSSKENARDLLCRIVRKPYGAFEELAAYDWLTRCHVRIATQVRVTPSDVLAASGSQLDGSIEHLGAYFDVKAFGSSGYLAQRLRERLEKEIPDEQVLIEESWDLSSEAFQDLLKDARKIAAELRQRRLVRKGPLRIRLEAKKPVTVSGRLVSPYRLAKENALYAFNDAKQFATNSPFILMFVVHPWFNALSIHNDFAGADTAFTRSLARRAFMQFSADSTPLISIAGGVRANATLAEASRLLSAIFFLNVWPKEADPTITYAMPSWLYLNPRAAHRLTFADAVIFRTHSPNSTYIDDFSDDDY